MKTTIDANLSALPGKSPRNLPDAAAVAEARSLLARTVFTEHAFELQGSASGWSGMLCFRVRALGRLAHLKLSPPSSLLPGGRVAQEIDNARWAAEQGMAPKVLWADSDHQALLTEFVSDDARASQGTRLWGPVTKATIRALFALHHSEQGAVRAYQAAAAREQLDKEIDAALITKRPAPLDLEQIRRMGYELVDRLSQFPVRESLCHGDMNGCNSIFHKDRVFLIDWTQLKVGDPICELAYLGAHLGCEMAQTRRLWLSYAVGGKAPQEGLKQLRLQLALFHCNRYAMRVTGMPWHNEANRGKDLSRATRQLADDAQTLGLLEGALS